MLHKYFCHKQKVILFLGLHFHLIQLHLNPFAIWLLPLPSHSTDISSSYRIASFNSFYTGPLIKIQYSWPPPFLVTFFPPDCALTVSCILLHWTPKGKTTNTDNPEFRPTPKQRTPTSFLCFLLSFLHEKFQISISNHSLSSEFLFQAAKYLANTYLPERFTNT